MFVRKEKDMRRYWVQAIILAVVELDAAKMDMDDRLWWHTIFEGARR